MFAGDNVSGRGGHFGGKGPHHTAMAMPIRKPEGSDERGQHESQSFSKKNLQQLPNHPAGGCSPGYL